jgi:protein-S-isoprenylcysteine O-methyltransferase Ste14
MGSIQTFTDVANRLLLRRDGFFSERGAPEWVGMIAFALGIRFLLGLAVLGSLSFLSLLLSLSLFAPLQLANGLRGTGIFTRRRGNGNGNGGTPAGQIMIVLFVLIGAANTLVKVYRLNERITQRLLMYVETQILEVNPAERRGRARERRRKWYVIWWKEGRWARREGWEEVRVRLWMGAREGLGPVWERMWTGRGGAPNAIGVEG